MTPHDAAGALSPDDTVLRHAARRLADGGLVAFPTETVYGLGADALNPDAIARIYAAKQRPVNHPLIVHLPPNADVEFWAGTVTPPAQKLMDAFWPGPLTLILPRASHIPAAVAGGQPTVGMRCPSHPIAQTLLRYFSELCEGGHAGVAAPSANRFGQVSPTRAAHVQAEFADYDASRLLVLDGGASTVGIESTIVDVSDPQAPPTLLRPGHITPDQIAAVLGVMPVQPHAASPQVSGSLKAHYAPRTPLYVVNAVDDLERTVSRVRQQAGLPSEAARIAVLAFSPVSVNTPPGVDVFQCAAQPDLYAQHLYDTLRRLDGQGYAALLFEQPPTTAAWQAVNDRLGRAAAAFTP